MNQPEPMKTVAKTDATPKSPSKAPWHRPTVTFVPLQGTAFFSGSPTDGSTSGTIPTSL